MNRLVIDAATDRLINVLDEEGKIMFDKWFVDGYDKFVDGYCAVEVEEGKWNYINEKGEFLLDECVDDAEQFENGYGEIMKDGKSNFINTRGEIIFNDKQFDKVFDSFGDNYVVKIKDANDNVMFNVVNPKEKTMVFDKWYECIDEWSSSYRIKRSDGCWNIADSNGKFLFNEWFDDLISSGIYEWSVVKKGNKYNYINDKGEFLFPEHWFDFCSLFWENENIICAKEGNTGYVFDQTGRMLVKAEYDSKGKLIAIYDYNNEDVIDKIFFNIKKDIMLRINILWHKIINWFKTKKH